jgi:hypothetical protein
VCQASSSIHFLSNTSFLIYSGVSVHKPILTCVLSASSDGFSPAEIPELSAPEIERRISELRMITSIFHPLRSLADPTAQRARRRFLPLWIASLQVSAASLLCATQLDLFFPDPGLCPLQAYCLASPFCYHPSDSCLCIHVVFALRFGNREHVLNVLGPL